jgi:type IX secretion system PorP/SprF family membrane protein
MIFEISNQNMVKKLINSVCVGKIIFFLMVLTVSGNLNAQDVQFSQFYAAPLYLNPAFAGSAHQTRGIFHSRWQWPGLGARYFTSLLSIDSYFHSAKSGVGFMGYFDDQSGIIKSMRLSGQYSYEITLAPEVFIRPALEFAYYRRSLNYSDLIFSDQVTQYGINTGADISNAIVHMADLSTGALLYSKNFWFGATGNHLNRPDESFTRQNARLPVKYTFVSGYKIFISGEKSNINGVKQRQTFLIPTVHYKFQGKSDQFDAGIYCLHDIFLAGLWYRGIPFKYYWKELHNNESVVFQGGVKISRISVSYSYDWVVSRLSRAMPNGAHEINITYVYDNKPRNRPMKRLPCPSFH